MMKVFYYSLRLTTSMIKNIKKSIVTALTLTGPYLVHIRQQCRGLLTRTSDNRLGASWGPPLPWDLGPENWDLNPVLKLHVSDLSCAGLSGDVPACPTAHF